MFRVRPSWPTLLLSVAAVARPIAAQNALTPPSLVQVNCEYVKAGMGMAHDQHEERWARAAEAVKSNPAPSLAVQSQTGPAATCWLTATNSYEQIGKVTEAMMGDATYAKLLPSLVSGDAQYVADTRSYIAALRPDLTGGAMPNVLSRRVTMWSEWRIRPGQEAAFGNAVKAYRAAMERAGVTPDFRVYQVLQGAPGATFWIFTSRASMAAFDGDRANDPKIERAFTPEDGKLFEDFFAKAVMSVNENLWNYIPSQSVLTAEQRASDPFWKRRVAAGHTP